VLVSILRGVENGTPPIITFICSIFAKSSAVWIPSLFIGTSTHFKLSIVNRTAINQQGLSHQVESLQTTAPTATCINNQIEMVPVVGEIIERNNPAVIKLH
jgi:uncharacterized protein YybS (DUF2232 family)